MLIPSLRVDAPAGAPLAVGVEEAIGQKALLLGARYGLIGAQLMLRINDWWKPFIELI